MAQLSTRVAQLLAGGTLPYVSTITNPTTGDTASWRSPTRITATYGNPTAGAIRQLPSSPGFSNLEGISLGQNLDWGSNFYGGGTNSKVSSINLQLVQTAKGAGQKIVQGTRLVSYSMGDNALSTGQLTFAGGPITGDEGTGFNLVTSLTQQNHLKLTAITSVTRSALSTTLTQAVTADDIPQTVSVASSAGAVVGDWLVINQGLESSTPNIEAVQVISIPSGTSINAIFACNHTNGTTVKPALVLGVGSSGEFGEQRTIVNLDGTSYSTGTVSGIAGGEYTGTGTTWTNTMVGGDALNIGAICLDEDTVTGSPFNGSVGTQSGPLKSWYNILGVTDTTHLGIHSKSVAGDASYQGRGPGAGGYTIKPAVRILRLPGGTTVVCEYTATTWTVGDDIECVICPFPDVSGFQYHMSVWTPGGIKRAFMDIKNVGLEPMSSGFVLTSAGSAVTLPYAWNTGMELSDCNTGIAIANAQTAAIVMGSVASTGYDSDNAGKIQWSGGHWLMPNSTNLGTDFQMVMSGTGGRLSAKSNTVVGSGANSLLNWDGMFQTKQTTFANLATPAAALKGCIIWVTNSDTAVAGATITGTGANEVLAVCTGSVWKVIV